MKKNIEKKINEYHNKFITTIAIGFMVAGFDNKKIIKWMAGLLEKYRKGLIKNILTNL